MDVSASIITIVSSTLTFARHVKDLIQRVRQRHEDTKELEDRLDTLTTIIRQAAILYGQDDNDSHSYSSTEQLLRHAIIQLVVRCRKDLNKFQIELKKLVEHGDWFSVAWREQTARPPLVKIENSISSHQHHLSVLVQLAQGAQVNQIQATQSEIRSMLQTLTNKTPTAPAPTANGDQPMRSQLAAWFADGEADTLVGEADTLVGEPEQGSQGDQEHNTNGILLLRAIEDGDHDAFTSLLRDGATSLKEKDGKERNPLLLAAHLDKVDMVDMLLTDTKKQTDTCIQVPCDKPADAASLSPPGNDTNEKDSDTNHREIDLDATDNLGRTALHYCAEFGLCEAARSLLDHGVNVNARDNGDFPTAYFAAKYRKYYAMKLLLSKGATTDFKRPQTSFDIKQLLEKSPNNSQPAPRTWSRPKRSKNRSMSTPPRQRDLSSIIRRWSSAMG
ncbi:MAG: hypothetical protein Q9188_007392 [Gyalolechia gomerana]